MTAVLSGTGPVVGQTNARKPSQQAEPVNPLDRSLPEGALKAVDASPDRFNAPVPLRFNLKGAEFDRTASDVALSVNGAPVAAGRLAITAHQIATDVRLVDGANVVKLKAYDTVGRPLYYNHTIWCGNWALRVDIIGENGAPVRSVSTVEITVPRADGVRAQQISNRGSVTLKNLPAQKVIITVRTSDGASAITQAFGSAGAVRVQIRNPSASPDAHDVPRSHE